MFGLFLNTELRHSQRKAIETTATYSHEEGTYLLQCPNTNSTRYIQGTLANKVTHITVFARLICPDAEGKCTDCGIQAFLIDLSQCDEEANVDDADSSSDEDKEHRKVKKIDLDGIRIPRENMLMEISTVDEDGQFALKRDGPKLLNDSMMIIRASTAMDCPRISLAALKIAFRYAAVKRHYKVKGQPHTPRLIDH
jgi:hypothetical protein